VGHNDAPSEISLSFHSEVVPIVLQVGIRRAENLPAVIHCLIPSPFPPLRALMALFV